MTMVNCNICLCRLLSHARSISCVVCLEAFHVKCLSIYNDVLNVKEWICEACITSIFPFNHIESEYQFIKAVSETGVKNCNQLEIYLEDKVFNPILIDEDINEDDRVNFLLNADPDYHYYNDENCMQNVLNCEYYYEGTFTKKCLQYNISHKSFTVMHFNIGSMQKNLNSFELYLKCLNFPFKIIGLTETWLNVSNSQCYSIEGYNIENCYRSNRSGGGASILLSNEIEYILREEFTNIDTYIESIFIEIPNSVPVQQKHSYRYNLHTSQYRN